MKGYSYKPVAEAWAVWNEDQCGRCTKTKGRVRFYNTDFYSYQTVVAKYHKNPEGRLYVLVTSRHWSTSTQSHIKIAMRHIGNVPVFQVPWNVSPEHELNLQHLWNEVLSFRDMAVRNWRHTNEYSCYGPTNWPFHLRDRWERVQKYSEITGVEFELTSLNELMTQVRTTREMKWAEWHLPSNVRRRERAVARREAISALNL